MSNLIQSSNLTSYGDYTYPEVYIEKDMINESYNYVMTPGSYPQFFPGMAPLIDENIVAGDKTEENRLIASEWNDWGNDNFDNWGFFYLYDPSYGQYYFPIISPQNEEDGVFTDQSFNVFGRTFTIRHGWAVNGVFKFDISVGDNLPFRFGAYGNMGSDGDETLQHFVHQSAIANIYYMKHQEDDDDDEILYSYFIPKRISQNASQTYVYNISGSDDSIISNEVNEGLIVYFSKGNDVIEWIADDINSLPVVPICFPAGTPVVTDQGEIAIEKINPAKNTIRGKKIVAITKTTTIEDKIVCIEKDSFGPNIPSQKTFISRNHKLFYNKQMIKAKHLIGKVDGIYNKKYNGEVLYNVLLETHEKMLVNNLIVETLDPKNIVAQLYNGSLSVEERNNAIININQCAKDYKKLHGHLK